MSKFILMYVALYGNKMISDNVIFRLNNGEFNVDEKKLMENC